MRHIFVKKQEIKVIRTRYEINLAERDSAESIIEAMKNVPPKAVLIEIYKEEDEDATQLTFVEEKSE